jgi:hypothetical protein
LENTTNRMEKYCCLSPFRSIIPCAMVSMWQGCSMSCRRCVITTNNPDNTYSLNVLILILFRRHLIARTMPMFTVIIHSI